MTRPRLVPLLAGLAACSPDLVVDGTAVGNATVELTTPTAPDVASAEGTWRLASLSVQGCDGGGDKVVAEGIEVSLVGGSRLALPTGSWCGLSLVADAPARWLATTTSERTLDVSLDLDTVAVGTPRFDADDPLALVLRLAGATPWLDGERLGALDGDVTIDPASPEHAGLVAEVRTGRTLFDDADDDLELDDDESVLAGEDDDDGDDTDEDDDDTESGDDTDAEDEPVDDTGDDTGGLDDDSDGATDG